MGVPLGVWMIEVLDPMVIRRVIGVVVAALAAILLVGWTYNGSTWPLAKLDCGRDEWWPDSACRSRWTTACAVFVVG